MYASIGLALGAGSAWQSIVKLRSNTGRETGVKLPHFKDWLSLLVCAAVGIVLWMMGNKVAAPAYDEVFSAENIAGIHPFQGWSYYMLPNNHIGFNLLNNIVSRPFPDKVITGRVISLLAYLGTIVTLFFWLKRLLGNRIVAILVSLTLVTQFPVWGFGFQARGYAIYLLAEWGALIALFSYLRQERQSWLYVYVFCCVAGYFCMPSFLYLHFSILAFLAVYHRKDRQLWIFQLYILAMVFLLYLPALCFSGIDAIIKNKYVGPMKHYKTTWEFMQWMFPYFGGYLDNIYSGLKLGNTSLGLTLLLLPLALLCAKRSSPTFMVGVFYIVLWLVFFIMSIAMKRLPFDRNLVFHYNYTLFCDLWVVYWLMGLMVKDSRVTLSALSVAAFAGGYHYIKTNPKYLKDSLYGYDVTAQYNSVADGLRFIPTGSKVAFSDEGFYCCYLSRKRGCVVQKCPTGQETYYIKSKDESMPANLSASYTLASTFNDYEIYRHN